MKLGNALAEISRHYDDLQEALRRPADMADKILDYAAFASLIGVALQKHDRT